jgi:predicted AAA+ superfamily ATPase
MLQRTLHAHITKLLKQFPAVAILGPRQVGKTTLAKQLAAASKKETLYIDLEKQKDRVLLTDMDTFFEENKNKCIIIDEVQTMPHVFTALRPAIDDHRKNGRFILLGSASPMLVKGVSESLAGRISYTQLTPFMFEEVSAKVKMEKHWFRGGFPNSILAKTDAQSAQWIHDFIETYIQRDMSFIFNAEINTRILRYLWAMIANNQGGIWNAELYARALGVSAPTVLRYLDFLEGTYLVRRLQPYFANVGKRLIKSPKVYIKDSGLLHQLCDLTSITMLKKNTLIGASWEGYVIEEILKKMPTDIHPYYYRTQAGTECDLVLAKGIKVLACIEIKHSDSPTLSKGFYESIRDLNPKKSFVITPNSHSFKLENKIQITTLQEFIEKFSSL